MRTLVLLALSAAALAAQTPAASAAQVRFDSAFFAWERGDYPDALARFERLLAGPDASRFVESIALITGELYRTVTVGPDGLDARWAAAAPVAAFATNARRSIQVIAVDGDSVRTLARMTGMGVALAPDGARAAYLAVPETPPILALRFTVDSLRRIRDFAAANRQAAELTRLEREAARVVLRDLRTGRETELPAPHMGKYGLTFSADGSALYFSAVIAGDSARADIYAFEQMDGTARVRPVIQGPGVKQNIVVTRSGRLVYVLGATSFAVADPATGAVRTFAGASPAVSADGSLLVWVHRTPEWNTLHALRLEGGEPVTVMRAPRTIATPAPSPDGRRIAFAMMPRDDWEVYVVGADGRGEVRLTREIQHDRFPRWVDQGRLLAVKGEPRHARAWLYDVDAGTAQRLHHNNTVRTVAPEYEWAVSPDGSRVLVVADRDGDTISPERGVYLIDLGRRVTRDELRARVTAAAAAERELRERGARMFAPIQLAVRQAVREVSVPRIYEYGRALFQFDSKHITQPGNHKAIEYIASQLRQWGYEPEVQWFEPRPGIRTANVIATLRGTANPELIYVASSHFDSVEPGPGADDNTSGTAALLEAARVMATRPQPATIKFAFFTGEEAGLLGSREFVRRAIQANQRIVGALNNDMIGWSGDHRLDNTVRYSNDGLRDLQHAAAFLFTDLITYDARYYQNTDAHAYYEAYGDIVAGIGSYPILGNPHYHQTHDVLETVNHQLVAEVSRTTLASLMLMASSPARLTGVVAAEQGSGAAVRWEPAPERGVARYVVTYGPVDNPALRRISTSAPAATLPGAQAGWRVGVKAVMNNGAEGWDWARAVVKAGAATPAGEFWNALQSLCGRAFAGTVTRSVPPDTVFSRATLVMHVRECSGNEIRIPFHVGEDRSRTWVLTRTASGLRLKHDHRHADGTPDQVTQYGGDTKDRGTAGSQEFHADAHTASLIPAAATNIWTMEVVPGERFVYALRRVGTEREFRAAFDLRAAVAPPPPPWGAPARDDQSR